MSSAQAHASASGHTPLWISPQSSPVDPATFRATLALAKTKPETLEWASIPQQIDLWEARRLALAAHFPIFM